MIPQYWSWLLAIVGVTGLWFAGSHRLIGWQIGLGVQALWIAYAIVSEQYGFIASAVAYAVVNLRNLLKWKRENMGKIEDAFKDWLDGGKDSPENQAQNAKPEDAEKKPEPQEDEN